MFLLLAFGYILAFGCTLSFNRRCLQKFLHHLQSSLIIIFIHHHLLHSKTNTNTCVHTYFLKICYFRDVYWRFTKMYSPLSSCHRIIVMSSNHRHHLPHTLKQTQNFVFIHILQYVILEVFAELPFGNMDRFLMLHVCCIFSVSSSSD